MPEARWLSEKREAPSSGEEMSRKKSGFSVQGFLLISCGTLGKSFKFFESLFLNL